MNEDLEKTIIASLQEVAPETDPQSLERAVPLRDQLDLDSMDFLRFVQALDRRLGVAVPEADYPKLATLRDCVSYLAARVSAK